MSDLRYPNESQKYREARDALLKEEQELIAKVKAVAAKRRTLPDGGQLKEDYVFQWANDGKVGQRVKFSELFGGGSGQSPLEPSACTPYVVCGTFPSGRCIRNCLYALT